VLSGLWIHDLIVSDPTLVARRPQVHNEPRHAVIVDEVLRVGEVNWPADPVHNSPPAPAQWHVVANLAQHEADEERVLVWHHMLRKANLEPRCAFPPVLQAEQLGDPCHNDLFVCVARWEQPDRLVIWEDKVICST